MAKLNKQEFSDLLITLDTTHDSIVATSSQILNLASEYFDPAVQLYFDHFKQIIDNSLVKNKVRDRLIKVVNYLYLANDVLQKAKATNKDIVMKSFEKYLPQMVDLICSQINDRSLIKEILKVSSDSPDYQAVERSTGL
jgi:hypothetical protein